MFLQATTKERDLLARLMRAEAVGEGELGMLMVGNVGANRVIADCLTFVNIRTITEMINQKGAFTSIESPLFFSSPTTAERNLADRIIRGEYYHPATNALWFYAPRIGEDCLPFWYNQRSAGRFKNHCFYQPDVGICKRIH